jgi:hypothetical protein
MIVGSDFRTGAALLERSQAKFKTHFHPPFFVGVYRAEKPDR